MGEKKILIVLFQSWLPGENGITCGFGKKESEERICTQITRIQSLDKEGYVLTKQWLHVQDSEGYLRNRVPISRRRSLFVPIISRFTQSFNFAHECSQKEKEGGNWSLEANFKRPAEDREKEKQDSISSGSRDVAAEEKESKEQNTEQKTLSSIREGKKGKISEMGETLTTSTRDVLPCVTRIRKKEKEESQFQTSELDSVLYARE